MNDNEKRKLAHASESFARLILSHENRDHEFDNQDLFRECSEKLIYYARQLSRLCSEELKGSDHKTFKKCTKCEKTKTLTEFYKQPRFKDGYGSHCKKCHKSYIRGSIEYKKRNKL